MNNAALMCLTKDNFCLLKECKRLFIYSDLYVYENFPKAKKHLKIMYFDECEELIENIIMANNSEKSIRKKYQVNALLNISKIDFLITYFYDLKIVHKKRYLSVIRILSNVKGLLIGWINEPN